MRDLLIRHRITPNTVTLFSCILCIFYASLLIWTDLTLFFLLFLPLLLLLRMMFNALDGMIASVTDNQTPIGSVLNEVCDVISDLALFSAFALILSQAIWLWWLLIVLSVMIEFTALAVYQATGVRPFSGPFGKSDRAVYLGLFAILLLLYPDAVALIYTYIVVGLTLATLTIINRLKLAWLHKI